MLVKRIILVRKLKQLSHKLILLVILFGVLAVPKLAGQNGIVDEIEWKELLNNERFLSNASIYRDGKKLHAGSFVFDTPLTISVQEVTFSTDSVFLNTTIAHANYTISAPNDIGLLLNSDKIELVHELKQRVKSQKTSPQYYLSTLSQHDSLDTLQIKTGLKHGLLHQLKFISTPDSVPVCSREYPQASVINAFGDTLDCDGMFPLKLVFHEYGQNTDTLDTTVSAFIRSSGTDEWICWTITENDNVVILLEHPILRFNHMLYLRPFNSNQLNYWLVDLHAYIPSYNVLDIFSIFSQSKNAETIEIK